MKPLPLRLPDDRVWLRVADPGWVDPFDPAWAGRVGGRWNPPGSFPVLYLNADIETAKRQIERLLEGSPVRLDDLGDDAFVLVAATLPRRQRVADAVSPTGLRALGLPRSYPRSGAGEPVGRDVCQAVGVAVRRGRLRGVWCRSAATADGAGRKLAWFPAGTRSKARPVWDRPLPLARWRHACRWSEIGLTDQADPRS